MRQSIAKIPPFQFYTAIGQILSRVCHEHSEIVAMLIELIARILSAYPQQAIWSVVSLHEVRLRCTLHLARVCSPLQKLFCPSFRQPSLKGTNVFSRYVQ